METRIILVLLLSIITTIDCHPQEKINMRIWMKDGNMYQYPIDNVDSIDFDFKSDFRNWQELMRFPSVNETAKYNETCTARSPYLCAWFQIQNEETFTQFSIDFKADYIPSATYCSPFNLHIDYSSLLEKYDSVNNDGYISVYGGLQRQSDGTKYNSIVSVWDVYCKKISGERDTIKATLVSPVEEESVNFNHEGNGVSFRPDYPWRPRKWYRMLIQLGKSETTSNTTLEQWIGDLSEKKWKQLCIFDLGTPNLKFKGQAAAFLENFNPRTAGDIRSMEFKNIRILSSTKNKWVNIYSAHLYNDSNQEIKKSGSYQYGTDDDTFWMITTGLPNCAEPQEPGIFEVGESESGSPLSL